MTTKDTVLDVFTHFPTANIKDVMRVTEKSESTVRKALKELVADGSIVKSDDGYFSQPAEGDKRPRANHGYARNTKTDPRADKRDGELLDFLQSAGEAETLKDIADGLGITVRAARHAVWRNLRTGLIEKVERKFYQLVEDAA